jgi:LemA protein
MTVVWVALGVVAAVAVLVAASYNRFVNQRQLAANSWSTVETELRRRYDLIPNLVETVRGYAAHERQTLEAVVQARTMAAQTTGTPREQEGEETRLSDSVRRLMAVAEGYPELRVDAHFLALQEELSATENRIQAARRFYNGNVRDFNSRVESVPSNLVARAFGFERLEYFQLETAVREAPAPAVA